MDQYWGYLISALLGFIFGFVPLIVLENHKEHRTRRRIALAIHREINSLYELAKEKGWLLLLKAEKVKVDEADSISFLPPIAFDYFRVYESNLNSIALLEPMLMENIINFYNKLKSLLEDVKLQEEKVKERAKCEDPKIREELLEDLNRRQKLLKDQTCSIENLKDEITEAVKIEDKKCFIATKLCRCLHGSI